MKLLLTMFLLVYKANSITLNNGRYEDIYIVIQDSVDENLELLDRIQVVFTKASELLFTATKNQVYFGKIKVVIPKSWSTQTHYKQLPALSSLETYINIGNWKISSPHVKSKTFQCGEEGSAMYLQPSFFLQTGRTNYGNHENVIVHEWGHLRWGLFDEYPTRIGRSTDVFYQHEGKWKPVGCSHKVRGRIGRNTNCNTEHKNLCDANNSMKKMEKICYFCPYTDQDVKISLMGYQYIDQMSMFCDKDDETVPEDERHNRVAPNAQNKLCDGKSAWEVMREHEDFKMSSEETLTEPNTTPDFEFIQENNIYMVFVLDVSGSMGSTIGILAQAGEYVIQEKIPFGSSLAIVTFNDDSYRSLDMKQVNSQEDKDEIVKALPLDTGGSTCIGCGIDAAIQVLTEELGSAENGQIVLITDGMDNSGDLSMSRSNAIASKVKINTIAVSQQATTLLPDIAKETGGKHYTYLEIETISFAAVFNEAISGGTSITTLASQPAMLISEKLSSNVINTTFSIETGMGKDTSVTVFTAKNDDIHIQLNGPGSYSHNLTVYGNKIAALKIDGIAQAGDYYLVITTKLQSVEYLVTTSPTITTNDVIRVVSRLSKSHVDLTTDDFPALFVDVTKNNAPVINVTVVANVESNTNLPCTLYLHDNGIYPDRLKNDGTYSCYILPSCLAAGRVYIKVKAAGKGGEIYLLYSNSGSASVIEEEEIEESIPDSFQRNVVTEELYVSNYIYDESVDTIAPGRITDVEINYIESETTQSGENRNLTLTWTATGDDKNQGRASAYEMRISSNIETLRDNFELADHLNMTNSSLYPQVVGTTEALKLVVNAEESFVETMYFAVLAVDDAGNKGPVSNIVSIVVARYYRVSGEQGYAVNEEDDDAILDLGQDMASQARDNTTIIVVVTVTFVGLPLIVILAVVTFKMWKKPAVTDNRCSDTLTEVVSYHPKQLDSMRAPSPTERINDPKLYWLK